MITEKHIALMNGEIDGTNSPEDTSRLQEVLSSDEEVRTYFEDLARLNTMLDSVEEMAPPEELKSGIMKAIHGPAAERPAGHPTPHAEPVYDGWLNTFLGGFRHSRRWAYGLAFAAGIAVGALGINAAGDSMRTGYDEGMSGTMAPPSGMALVDRQDLNESGVTGAVEMRTGEGRSIARLEVEANRDLDIVVEYDSNLLSPIGFEQSAREAAGITMKPGQVKLKHHGKNTYVLTLGYPGMTASEVHVKFYSGGFLFQKTLKTLPDNE